MSEMPHSTTESTDQSRREAILETLDTAIDDLSEEIAAAEPTTADEKTLQLRRYHEIGYLANQFRKLKRDTDLDEMDDRLALLEEEKDV